jgi:hypothetical protein
MVTDRVYDRGVKKLLVVLAVLVVVLVGAWLLVRNRLRAAIEQRCASTLNADCEVDGLSLRLGGANATGIHITAGAGAMQGDIDAIEADFAWLPLLTSKSQRIAVRVVHPQVREALPVGDVAIALKNMGQGKHPNGKDSAITLDRLTVTDGDVDVKVNLLASLHIEKIAVNWAPDSPLEVSWSDAGFESMLGKQGTGACTIKEPPKGHVADVDCPNVKTKVDLDRIKSLSDLAKIFLKEKLP